MLMKCFCYRSKNGGCNLIYVFELKSFQTRINICTHHVGTYDYITTLFECRAPSLTFVYLYIYTPLDLSSATINRGMDLSTVHCSLYRIIFCKLCNILFVQNHRYPSLVCVRMQKLYFTIST